MAAVDHFRSRRGAVDAEVEELGFGVSVGDQEQSSGVVFRRRYTEHNSRSEDTSVATGLVPW